MKIKRIITNSLLLICSLLVLIFLSQPYFRSRVGYQVGYDMVQNAEGGPWTCNAVCIVLTALFASLLAIIALLGLLRAVGVIRFDGMDKALVWLKMTCVILIFLSTTISLICIGYQCGHELSPNIFNYSVGWASITNMIVGFATVFVYIIERVSIPKVKAKARKK